MSGLKMKYFVVKPSGNNIYAEASRLAMRLYASHIEVYDPTFAKELREWADKELMKSGKVKNFPANLGK